MGNSLDHRMPETRAAEIDHAMCAVLINALADGILIPLAHRQEFTVMGFN